MTFSASTVPGERDTRTVTITATNGNVGPAYNTLINGFTLTQISGPSCTPTITPPSAYPISLGDIATSGSASASFTISIVGCNPNSQFTVSVPWSSATYDTSTFVTTQNFRR
jgi:endo-1,4-beta-xylanase